MKKLITAVMAAAMAIGGAALAAEAKTLADWRFTEESVQSGTIADGNLKLKDESGNGNTLEMNAYGSGYASTASFVSDGLIEGQGSMLLNGVNDANRKAVTGVDFVTAADAPINKNSFENGYTIEIIYKMPSDWSVADRWSNLITRHGASTTLDSEYDEEAISGFASISNCKEILFYAAFYDDNHFMSCPSWSIAMD